jgi:hypothetical protein
MAMRFRRTLKIMPGVRLNVSKGGLSVSTGVRGASVTLGKRGVYANAGLPGSGLSYRTRIDKSPAKGTPRTTYREMSQRAAVVGKEHHREAALSEVEAHEAHLTEFRNVLRSRDRETFDWHGRLHFDSNCAPAAFTMPVFAEAAEKKALNEVSKLTQWRVVLAVSLAGAIFFDSPSSPVFFILAILGVMASLVGLPLAHVRRGKALEAKRASFTADSQARSALHEAEQDIWQSYAALAPRLRGAVETGNPEALAELLEEELANETLPVPLVFDADFDGLTQVTLDITLPDPEEIPREQLSMNTRNAVSRKAMTQRDRREIFGTLACGLALRIAYESFRVLQPLEIITIRGNSEQIDPATGHLRTVTSLALTVTRSQLAALNLDDLSPEAALKGLKGTFACSPRLELGLADITG